MGIYVSVLSGGEHKQSLYNLQLAGTASINTVENKALCSWNI
jgi:hypothetical protein